MLTVIGGLPATGKTTVSTALARATRASYLRVDTIETTVVRTTALTHPVGVVGYAVAFSLATEQLRLGLDVIVECVNPLRETRDAWLGVAAEAGVGLLEVELVCSAESAHRRRVATREVDIPDLPLPSWEQIQAREYQPWERDHLVIDTAVVPVDSAVATIQRAQTGYSRR
ncbi:AAA family ATPase [Kutzneria sp. CA-103260]|uniref:AAA family ATPase n=1 Tax=Kutzneria sp. CA-103260 TaxID=2802641 RepID=UPI001BAB5F5E|nr:AAA family ATPase [Kutzneria sp. CA-103260]QUQ66746.1 AAA domain protein [Kutzneria sp. CA-103260]